MRLTAILLHAFSWGAHAHGIMTLPPTRNKGALATAALEDRRGVFRLRYHTDGTAIPGTAYVNDESERTVFNNFRRRTQDTNKRPWRAPGTARVRSPCGWQYQADDGTAEQDGLNLAKTERTVWQAGSAVEVAWATYVNHGGGYTYRLCPSASETTEECFRETPLQFVGDYQWLQWLDETETRHKLKATRVQGQRRRDNLGNAQWTRNPIPGQGQFDSPVGQNAFQSIFPKANDDEFTGETLYSINMVDLIQIPADLKPGDYVLGWRWDSEDERQVFSNCADITVTEAPKETPQPVVLPDAPAPFMSAPDAPAPFTNTSAPFSSQVVLLDAQGTGGFVIVTLTLAMMLAGLS